MRALALLALCALRGPLLTSAPNAADRKIVWTRVAPPPVPIAQAFAVPQGGAAAAVIAQAVPVQPVQPTAQLVQAAAVPAQPYQAAVQAAVPGRAVASAPSVAAVAEEPELARTGPSYAQFLNSPQLPRILIQRNWQLLGASPNAL